MKGFVRGKLIRELVELQNVLYLICLAYDYYVLSDNINIEIFRHLARQNLQLRRVYVGGNIERKIMYNFRPFSQLLLVRSIKIVYNLQLEISISDKNIFEV
jgi:hypothetical protein